MKKVIITYGLIAGVIVSGLMLMTQLLLRNATIDMDSSMIIGYTTMVISLSLVFFGIKSFRDQHLKGSITFGKAFTVGILIAMVASLMYSISWEIYIGISGFDFEAWYKQCQMDQLVKDGASQAEIDAAIIQLEEFGNMYRNPVIRFCMVTMEIFPVGLIVTLISAGLLRKKEFLPYTE